MWLVYFLYETGMMLTRIASIPLRQIVTQVELSEIDSFHDNFDHGLRLSQL
jgi:hypothetical protein